MIKDISGVRYGRLVATKCVGTDNQQCALWLCECDCGESKIVRGYELRNGAIRSCGCLMRETAYQSRKTHGKSSTKLYKVWTSMKQRCMNANDHRYNDYGGRGISICDQWNSFEPFQEWSVSNGYHDGMSLDRIDNNGNYPPIIVDG